MEVLLKPAITREPSTLSIARTQSVQSHSVLSEDAVSECSDSSPASTPSRRSIYVAKQILAEATSAYTPKLAISAAKQDMCRNTGALGPLLEMLQVSSDLDKVRLCLDTVAFLCLDRANRKTLSSLDGIGAILHVLQRLHDPAMKSSALEALTCLIRHEDSDKVQLWNHPGRESALWLLHPKQSVPQLLDAISFARRVGFRTDGVLIEPSLLTSVADLLHPSTDPAVLVKALRFLRTASRVPLPLHLRGWHSAVFRMAPLLCNPSTAALSGHAGGPGHLSSNGAAASASMFAPWTAVCEEVLVVLLNLSEHDSFRNALFASGCVPPLLTLTTSASKVMCVSAACILSHLAEGGLSREQLCNETSLVLLLRAVQHSMCAEVTIGLLYVLCQLVTHNTFVKNVLGQCGTAPMLQKLLRRTADEDAVMGILQLLRLLDAHPAPLSGFGMAAPVADKRLSVYQQVEVDVFVDTGCHT